MNINEAKKKYDTLWGAKFSDVMGRIYECIDKAIASGHTAATFATLHAVLLERVNVELVKQGYHVEVVGAPARLLISGWVE